MKEDKMGFWSVIYWALLYPIGQRFKRDIKCWYSHNWEWTDKDRGLRKCKKCGEKQIVIQAYFEDDE